MGDYQETHKQVMDELTLVIPGVKGGKAFGYPSYTINGRVFAWVGGRGISIKLGKKRVAELVGSGDPAYQVFVVGGSTQWHDWLSITRDDPAALHDDLPLIEESIAYVSGG